MLYSPLDAHVKYAQNSIVHVTCYMRTVDNFHQQVRTYVRVYVMSYSTCTFL